MKLYFKHLVLIILFLITYVNLSNAQIRVGAKIDKPTMLIGEQTKLHLSITFPAKDTIGFPKLADSLIAKVLIVNIGKADTTFDKNDNNNETIHRTYTITSFDTGQYVIPQYAFHTKGGDVKTDEQVLTIKSVAVDTTKGIYDIKQPFQVKYGFFDWMRDNWKPVTGGALGVIIIIAAIAFWLMRPKKVVEVQKPKVVIPIHTEALNKLNEIKEQKIWQRDQVKEYHSAITDAVREYLEKRYNIKAMEQTSEEIFESLKFMNISEDSRGKLRQILLLADLAKFAKQKPLANENEQSVENAISFILSTKNEVQLNQDKGEGADGLV